MATFQILYWKTYPSQIRAEDDEDEVKIELHPRFQERIDAVATETGAIGTDDYLDGWNWSDPQERSGSAQEVADSVKAEQEEKFKA